LSIEKTVIEVKKNQRVVRDTSTLEGLQISRASHGGCLFLAKAKVKGKKEPVEIFALDLDPLGGPGLKVEPSSQLAKALNLSYRLALGMGLVSFVMRYYRESVLRRTDWKASVEPIWKWESEKEVFEACDSALRKVIDWYDIL
jgi:hypothetical protein